MEKPRLIGLGLLPGKSLQGVGQTLGQVEPGLEEEQEAEEEAADEVLAQEPKSSPVLLGSWSCFSSSVFRVFGCLEFQLQLSRNEYIARC